MTKSLKYIVALFGLMAGGACFRVSAQSQESWRGDAMHIYVLESEPIASPKVSMLDNRMTGGCAYIDWLHRPKKAGFIDELLGPIGQVKNGPYAEWTTKIAYLSVTGSMKFQSSPLLSDAWKLYRSTYDRYDFILGQEARKAVTFRLSGSYSMTGIKVFDTPKVAHCYNIGLRPELVLNRIDWNGNDNSSLTLSAIAGPELGVLFSFDNWILQTRFYAGVSAAARIDYSISDRFCLYCEPRLSYVPYTLRQFSFNRSVSASDITKFPSAGNLFGSLVRLNLGFRISF